MPTELRLLICWNEIGSVTSRKSDRSNVIIRMLECEGGGRIDQSDVMAKDYIPHTILEKVEKRDISSKIQVVSGS